MAFDPITAIMNIGGSLIDRLVPDTNAREKEKADFALAVQNQVGQALADQRDINKVEAASSSMFIAGWRPAVGWVCVTALFCYYVPYMLIVTGLWTWQVALILAHADLMHPGMLKLPSRPDLGISDLIGLLMSLLGIGTMRTVEKVQGVDTGKIATPAGPLGFMRSLFK